VDVAPPAGTANPHRAYISRRTLTSAENGAPMLFEVALKMRNMAELQRRVAQGEHVSKQELAAKYEPLPSDEQAVADWLTSQGFKIVRRSPNHLAIFARGKVSQVARALQVTFARVTAEGKEYSSAITAPRVPSALAPLLIGVNGLQPHIRMHRHIMKPNAADSGGVSYTPSQIAQAYQASGLYRAGITGAGQTIAIVIDTFPSKEDLIAFWNGYGINQSINNITFIQAVTGTLDGVSGEETLDTEWSSAMAPGAKVRVYAATDLANVDLDETYQQVYDDVTAHPELGIHQMSMSYGEGEIETTNTQMRADDVYFVELANAGVTLFASAGDGGSTPGDNPDTLEVESPASDPNVTGAGGTTLKLDANNNESSEVVWNDGLSGGITGGGTSGYWSRPSWQKGTGVASGAYRLLPDISCAADPDYGGDFYYTDPTEGVETTIGGTSWASPTCAGFCALINQARANLGLPAIGLLGPHIYPQIGTTNFRDIISGNNATPTSGGLYPAGSGFDEATGIGVPLVQTLAETIAGTQTLPGVAQPSPLQTVNQGQNAIITVTASGSPVSFQWELLPVGTTTWLPLSDDETYIGSATASLTVVNATTAMSGDQFQCVATYSGTGAITSQPSVLIVENPASITTVAGGQNGITGGLVNGTGTATEFNYPTGIAVDSSGNLYVADCFNNVIRKVTFTTSAGVVTATVTTPYGSLTGVSGSTNGAGNSASFYYPRDIAIDSTSTNLYVSDEGNNLIRKITIATGQVSTIGTAANPAFIDPKGIGVDSSGNVYVADSGNNVIRKIAATNGAVTILAGSGTFTAGYANGAATTQALFNEPIGLAVDSSKNVYVTEYNNEVVREITVGGVVSTVAGQAGVTGCLDGTGSQALFNVPRGIMVDGAGNLFVTDSYAPTSTPPPDYAGNNLLRKITMPAGVVTTLAGQAGVGGGANGTGSAAQFYNPAGLAMNSSGVLYVADASNNTIRAATLPPDLAAPPAITSAAAATLALGQTGGFFVTATGNPAPTFSWAAESPSTLPPGLNLSPAGMISGTPTAAGAYTITLTASNGIGTAATQNFTLNVQSPLAFSPWEGQPGFFTTQELANPALGGPAATPESDGVPNLLKYLYNINPAQPMAAADYAALPIVGTDTTTTPGTEYLTLTYRQYALETGITVNLQTSPDLQKWTTVSPPDVFRQVGSDPTTGDPIMEDGVKANGSTRQFIRLNVTQP